MINGTKERIIRKEVRFDKENSYSYELTCKESASVVSYGLPLYTVKVSMTDSKGTTKNATANDAFSDKGRALVFFDKIVRNLATPIDLSYIIEDEYLD